MFRNGEEPFEDVRKLLSRGVAVMSLDLYAQGQFLNSEKLSKSAGENPGMIYSKNQKAKLPDDSWQRSPVYYYGYNHSTFARRGRLTTAQASSSRARSSPVFTRRFNTPVSTNPRSR